MRDVGKHTGYLLKKVLLDKILSLVISKDWPSVVLLSESLYLFFRWLFCSSAGHSSRPSHTRPILGDLEKPLRRGEIRFLVDICLCLMVLRCWDEESFSGRTDLLCREKAGSWERSMGKLVVLNGQDKLKVLTRISSHLPVNSMAGSLS